MEWKTDVRIELFIHMLLTFKCILKLLKKQADKQKPPNTARQI